jgi:hypothetical protein
MMLASAGMTSGEMCASIPPLEKLYPLYARDAKEFESMGYQRKWEDRRTKNVKLLQHKIPSIYMATKRSKICPECIVEIGHVEAYWDLKYAIACPIHCREAIQKCEECGDLLNPFRPGLLTCACGADLSKQKGAEVEHIPTLGLLSLVRSKLLGLPFEEELLNKKIGFPVKHLKNMSFETLLGIIGRLEGHSPHTTRYESPKLKNTPVPVVLSRAAEGLSNWPNGLHEYLKRLNSEGETKQCYSLRMQFKPFYDAFFKSGLPVNEVMFVKKAFVTFGEVVWKNAYISPKLNSGEDQHYVGIYGLANKLGVNTSTARCLLVENSIPSVQISMNGVTRQLYDISQPLPFELVEGETHTLRSAAKYLELPVSVLKVLREQNVFNIKHIAVPLIAYHEHDLKMFRDKLLACGPKRDFDVPNLLVTLDQCMLMKTGSAEIKASIITAILTKKIKIVGRTHEGVGGMSMYRSELEKFLLESKTQFFGTITVVEAAKRLQCDPLVVKNLYQDGQLLGIQKANGLFIQEESLDLFANQYISCANIASKQKTNSTRIVSICEEKHIEIQWFPKSENQKPQPFISRQFADLK